MVKDDYNVLVCKILIYTYVVFQKNLSAGALNMNAVITSSRELL